MEHSDVKPLAHELGLTNIPAHVGIIMDGNRRWAKEKGQAGAMGYRPGVEALRGVLRFASDVGIKALSLYAFSTENWQRPGDEVSVLMSLLVEFLYKEVTELHANQVKIRFMGDINAFPKRQYDAICYAVDKTQKNTGLVANIALNYGSRAELARAAGILAQKAVQGHIAPDAIDDKALAGALYTAGLPDMDMLIRTGGEKRLSNFMLYQASYAELYFIDKYWPDFTREIFIDLLREYQGRDRRMGK